MDDGAFSGEKRIIQNASWNGFFFSHGVSNKKNPAVVDGIILFTT